VNYGQLGWALLGGRGKCLHNLENFPAGGKEFGPFQASCWQQVAEAEGEAAAEPEA